MPGQPKITSITTGDGSAQVTFDPPADNGAVIQNYAYRLTRENDGRGDLIPFEPALTATQFTLSDLNNGQTYTLSLQAINADGVGGEDSDEVTFTVGTQCEDLTSWTAPADELAYLCSVGGNDYAYADFDILTPSNNADICAEGCQLEMMQRSFVSNLMAWSEGSLIGATRDRVSITRMILMVKVGLSRTTGNLTG